jgi:hypothetical protein
MNRRLDNLIERDTKSRWSIYSFSMVVMAVAGFIADMNGMPLVWAAFMATVLGLGSLLWQVSLYVSASSKVHQPIHSTLKDFLTPLVAIPSAIVALLTIASISPFVQASALNRRLKAILESSSPATKKNAESAKVLKLANQSKVKLKPELVFELVAQTEENKLVANSKIQEDAEYLQWRAYVDAVTQNYISKGGHYPSFREHETAFLLDGKDLTNDTFDTIKVVYRGGYLDMKSVRFVDPVFEIADSENGRKFAEAILAAKGGPVSVHIPDEKP